MLKKIQLQMPGLVFLGICSVTMLLFMGIMGTKALAQGAKTADEMIAKDGQKSMTITEAKKEMQAFYDELMTLKDNEQFQKAGLSGGYPPALDFVKRVENFRSVLSSSEQIPPNVQIGASYLVPILKEYISTKGQDNQFILDNKALFKKSLESD